MDHFEQRIGAIRNELNQIEQPDHQLIWNRMQQQRRKRTTRRNWLAAAAAVAVLLISATLIREKLNHSPEIAALTHLSLEQRAEIVRCRQLIDEKERIIATAVKDGENYAEWQNELKTLEADQERFISDLATLPKDERYAETLVRFYMQKVRILELFIKKIDIQNNEKERLAHNRN